MNKTHKNIVKRKNDWYDLMQIMQSNQKRIDKKMKEDNRRYHDDETDSEFEDEAIGSSQEDDPIKYEYEIEENIEREEPKVLTLCHVCLRMFSIGKKKQLKDIRLQTCDQCITKEKK